MPEEVAGPVVAGVAAALGVLALLVLAFPVLRLASRGLVRP